jgi:hypothetical protein
MICKYIDEVVVGSGMGLSLIVGLWPDDSATKLKRGQLDVCTVYVYCILCISPPPPAAEICSRFVGNFYQ